MITITADDGVDVSTHVINVTVTPDNDLPTVSPLSNITIDEDTATGLISFTIGDVETPSGDLNVTVTSSNLSLIHI